MRSCYIFFASLALSLVAQSSQARDPSTVTLDCVFERLNSISVDDGKPSVVTKPESPLLTTITGLDAKAGSATLVGNLGSVPLAFFTDGKRWVFVQVTDTGNVTVTSMLDPSISGEAYAVHSRHMWFLGEGVISQWGGPCKVR